MVQERRVKLASSLSFLSRYSLVGSVIDNSSFTFYRKQIMRSPLRLSLAYEIQSLLRYNQGKQKALGIERGWEINNVMTKPTNFWNFIVI